MSYSSRVYRHRNAHTHENDNNKESSSFFGHSEKQSTARSGGSAFFQAKLSVNQPGDAFEREADSVANAVVNNRSGAPVVQQKEITGIQRLATEVAEEGSTDEERMKRDKDIQTKPEIQRMCSDCAKEEKEKGEVQKMGEGEKEQEDELALQAKSDGGGTASPQLSSRITNAAGKGRALPSQTLGEMQTSFGADFSNVNIHTDAESAQMNKELGAQAFTHGQDIYFNSGKFNPESSAGKHLLAHELTHVVQQGEGIHRKMGDGHDLQALRFRGDTVLEGAFDNEQLVRRGASGIPVFRIQAGLNDLGFSLPVFGVDGKFGPETERAVRSFQSDFGLANDGIVGPNTMGALDHAYANSDLPPLPICPNNNGNQQAFGGDVSSPEPFPIPCQGPSGKPACTCKNPPDTQGCDKQKTDKGENKMDIVFKAVKKAGDWLSPASNKMADFINPPDGKTQNAAAKAALNRHFAFNDATKSQTIQDVPGTVKKIIDNTFTNISNVFCGNCQDKCPVEKKDVFATSPGAWKKSNCYEFCEPFFKANLTLQAQIILHEMMHSWEDKADIAYEVDGPPDYPPALPTSLENADSYAALIRDLR